MGDKTGEKGDHERRSVSRKKRTSWGQLETKVKEGAIKQKVRREPSGLKWERQMVTFVLKKAVRYIEEN